MQSNLGATIERLGRHDDALKHIERGLALAERAGVRWIEASVLSDLGTAYRRSGCPEEALTCHTRALAKSEGSLGLRLESLNALGECLLARGDEVSAADHHRMVLELAVPAGERFETARAYRGLGLSLRRSDPETSQDHLTQAAALYTEIGVADS